MTARKTTEQFKKEAEIIHTNNKFNYNKVNYINNNTKVIIHCNTCNKEFLQVPKDHIKGFGCNYCSGTKLKTTESFIKEIKEKYPDNKFNYDKVIYKSNCKKIIITCLECNKDFLITPGHLLNGIGCAECAGLKLKTTEQFIKDAKIIFSNNEYNYDKVKYKNSKTKVIIHCNICNKDFLQKPNVHLRGNKCSYCAGYNKTTEEVIKEFKQIHKNNEYNYDKVNYIHNKIKITIHCNKCNKDFNQLAAQHLSGHGCLCKSPNRLKTTKEVIEEFKLIHKNNEYNYNMVNYIGAMNKINIYCNRCNKYFIQSPSSHLRGQGCPYHKLRVSKIEIAWLDSLNIKIRQYKISAPAKNYFVDGFNPETNTIYEFYGDYYHGNPKIYKSEDINGISKLTFGELYQKTIEKENILRSMGFNIISIWEDDYKKQLKTAKKP